MTVRGRATGPAAIPRAWRGPLPDPSLHPELPCDGGFTQVPEALLTAGLPDLGVMSWVVLRQRKDGLEQVVNYRSLADALGMRDVPSKAVDKRFARVIPAMVEAGWIERRRDGANRMHYRATDPTQGQRWAVLRRMHDLPLLESGVLHPRSGQPLSVTVSHLVDFARWQLECGRRGWTAASTSDLAARWGMSRRTVEMRRDSLAETGLLHVTRRAGHPDLVWLGELYDPRWLVPTRPIYSAGEVGEDPETFAENGGAGGDLLARGLAESGGPAFAGTGGTGHAGSGGRPSQKVGGPYKKALASSLPEGDLADLGGASATPLTSVTRVMGAAVPQAAPSRETLDAACRVDARRAASRLVSEHRYLVSAPAHFRAAMMARLAQAITGGLDERHLGRALSRVVHQADRDAHCELVRLAVQQAWADQRGGMCPECAGDGLGLEGHAFTCSARRLAAVAAEEDPAAVRAAILDSLTQACTERALTAAVPGDDADGGNASPDEVDVLAPFLCERLPAPTDWGAAPDNELVAGLEVALARLTAPHPPQQRVRALERAWSRMRPQVPPERRELLDLSAMRLRQRLEQHLLQMKAS